MKQKRLLVILLGFISISWGCGKSGGRTSGLEVATSADSNSIVEVSAVPRSNPDSEIIGLGNMHVLAAFKKAGFPEDLASVDNGSTIGTLGLKIKKVTFQSTYEKEIASHEANEMVSTPIPVLLVQDPNDGNQLLLVSASKPELNSLLYHSEDITANARLATYCSEVTIPHFQSGNIAIISPTASCTQDQICSFTLQSSEFVGPAHRTLKELLEWVPGSRCSSEHPQYLQQAKVTNVSKATEARVLINRSFPQTGAKTLVFKQ